jgi:adenylosuccinate synthase
MTDRHAIVVIDLAFGDCGKGTIVDFLARRHDVHTVVRFNGGPQAGHNVVTPDGRHHTFSQFGSAMFLPGVRTVLTRFMFIEPYAILNEAAHLCAVGVPDALDRLLIDGRCPVITPAHQAANRLREIARGSAAHGTCGAGFGETVQDELSRPEVLLYARELHDRTIVARKLRELCRIKHEELRDLLPSVDSNAKARAAIETIAQPSWIDAAVENYAAVARCTQIVDEATIAAELKRPGTVIYEGAQGVLLDQDCGFHPHTTWSRTTFANAETVLGEIGFSGQISRIGTLRTYFTRHGNGPLVTEDDTLRAKLPEPHNGNDGWQGRFRLGHFDAVAARYALRAAGNVDGLAITHLDRLASLRPKICTAYDQEGIPIEIPLSKESTSTANVTRMLRRCSPVYATVSGTDTSGWLEFVQQQLSVPVLISSSGPTAADKRMHPLGNAAETGSNQHRDCMV